MALDRHHGKDWVQPYRGSAAFDPSCRVGGTCPWCSGNRTYQERKELSRAPKLGRFCDCDDECDCAKQIGTLDHG